ncbi:MULTISPECIES: type II secretion system protein [Pseudoalteromonas]|uniref:type II secretion system protein n=1 Tax=Pseudoalteromonas TaxID=53246 RepID=UPI0030CA17D4
MHSITRQYAFTLIELLLVMVILGILAVSAFSFIGAGVSIYAQGVERQEAVAQARFLITRISKELRHATPNSLRLSCDNDSKGACNTHQCLEFTPFLSATHYTNYLPTTAPFNITAVDFELNNLTKPQAGNWAAVYPLNSDDIYNENNHKRLQVLAFDSTAGNAIDQWQFSKAFAAESPSKRLYLLAEPVSFCVEGQFLYRYTNYAFNSTQSDAPSLQVTSGVKRDLLGIYIANNLASNLFFTIEPVALQRNAVLNVNAQMRFNETEVMNFNHEVHVPNVP